MRFLAEAKQRGYALNTIFVSLKDVEENVRRARFRANVGGHKVPTGRVRDTFGKSLALAPYVLQMSDLMRVYDNSGKGRIPLLEKDHSRITLENSHIAWCREKIYEPYRVLILEGQAFAKRYAPVGVPTLGPDETLTGSLVEEGNFFIVQRVEGVDMLHPRGLIDPDNLEKFLTDRGGDLHFRDPAIKRLRFGQIEDISKLRSCGYLQVCGENFLVGALNVQRISAIPVLPQEQGVYHDGRILLANERLCVQDTEQGIVLHRAEELERIPPAGAEARILRQDPNQPASVQMDIAEIPLHEKKENAVVLRESSQPEEREKALRKTLGLSKVVEAKSGREYKGRIVHVDREAGIAWMETGWKSGVLHQLRELDAMPKEGAAVIAYGKDGARGCVRQGPEVEKQVAKHLANERGR